jgi:hypothetical protein
MLAFFSFVTGIVVFLMTFHLNVFCLTVNLAAKVRVGGENRLVQLHKFVNPIVKCIMFPNDAD